MGTRMRLLQRWPSQPSAPFAAAMNSDDAVETVGLSKLTFNSIVPRSRPTAACSIFTILSGP